MESSPVIQYLADKAGLPYTTLRFMLSGWETIEFPTCSVMVLGNEVHVVASGPIPRSAFRRVFAPLIERYGEAVTHVPHNAIRSMYFVERIGFVRCGDDGTNIHYRIDHVPFTRIHHAH